MNVRRFGPEDEGQCIELRKESWIEVLSKAFPKRINEKWTHLYKEGDLIKYSKKNEVWVAEEGGRVLAFLAFEVRGDRAAIGFNYARPSERGKGVGKKLYNYVEPKVLERHPEIKLITVDAVWFEPSIKFYESVGFKGIREVIHNNDPADKTLWMEKTV